MTRTGRRRLTARLDVRGEATTALGDPAGHSELEQGESGDPPPQSAGPPAIAAERAAATISSDEMRCVEDPSCVLCSGEPTINQCH